jgi:hypothetical protein
MWSFVCRMYDRTYENGDSWKQQWRTEGEFWGFNTPLPPEIPKFWQTWAEFPVPWKIHPWQPNKNTSFTHLQIERNPWLGGYRPLIPVLSTLCPQLNLLNTLPLPPSTEQNSWVRHWKTGWAQMGDSYRKLAELVSYYSRICRRFAACKITL